MAFALAAIVGSTTVTLSDGAPFTLRAARGMGGADIRRVTTRGAAQHGDTDKGYRLNPRQIELVIGFRATTDAILDGYRDTLTSIFKPLPATPVKLRVTRDDGVVRQIDCNVVGPIVIKLLPEHRPGHYHEAKIQLRAADPAWYNPTAGSVSVVGTSLIASQWWLAGDAIGSAQVAEYGTAPTQGQVWTYTGTPLTTSPGGYTVAFRSAQEAITDGKYAFFAGDASGSPALSWSTSGTTHYQLSATYPTGGDNLGTIMAPGTHNYYVSYLPYSFTESEIYIQRDAQAIFIRYGDYIFSGTARRWRSNAANDVSSRWSNALDKYAVYVPALAQAQVIALDTFMNFAEGEVNKQTIPIAYLGDLPEYPSLSITGPVTNPSITNLATGHTLDFGTITIGAGTTYVISTAYGQKGVFAGTVNKDFELTNESDLGEFYLAPAPTAAGGTNILYLNGTAMGTATRFAATYYHRYSSF